MTSTTKFFGLIIGMACTAMIGCTAEQGEEGTEGTASEAVVSEETSSEQAKEAAAEDVASEVANAESGEVTAMGAAPSCIKKTFLSSNQIHLSSTCNFDTGVRVIISWGRDSGCIRIPAHRTGYTYWWAPGSFDRLDSC